MRFVNENWEKGTLQWQGKMESNNKNMDTAKKCEMCDRKMNPTVNVYKEDTRLRTARFGHLQGVPEHLARSVERFLIGNAL